MILPGTVDYQLSADWDLYMQAVRGTDSTVAFKSMTSSVSTAVHVLIHTDVAHVPRFLVRMVLPLARPKFTFLPSLCSAKHDRGSSGVDAILSVPSY
jgi:hypothetical protein